MTDKTRVLMLCDHPLSTSGVGVQSRYLINGLVATGRYSFKVFGGAIKHESYDTVTVNPDFVIKPTNGFGDMNMMRQVLAQERPDVLLLFTDPRFFLHYFEREDEIHQVCPIAYNMLWDAPPWPEFNRVLYESTDLMNCINWPTYEMVHERFPDKTNYIPHAVPPELFFPMEPADVARIKPMIMGKDRADHFVVTYVGRNARRKMTSDIIVSFKAFLTELQQKHGHDRATLVYHSDPLDPEGPNLHHVVDMLHLKDHIIFSKDRIGFADMNALYNISDVIINRSCNEGYGLPLLEAKMAGKPIIALKTGGMTRQVEDHETGEQYGIALEPEVTALVGNQIVPYIYEHYVSHETVTKAMMTVYEWGPAERARVGQRARAHALKEYSMKFLIDEWDRTLTKLIADWKTNPPKRWEVKEL